MRSQALVRVGFCFNVVCLFIFAVYALTYEVLLWDIKESLHTYNKHIQSLIVVSEGNWDMSRYNADTLTPHPQGSSGYLKPLYIITRDGFVIERSNPIGGFLDSAEAGSILALKTPTTIQSVTGESWRVLATKIESQKQMEGVVLVAKFSNNRSDISAVDAVLASNSAYIAKHIKTKAGVIDASSVDVSHIDFDVTFEIVGRNNKVVRNNGRVPTTIDVSHLADELRKPPSRIETRNGDNKRFVVDREELRDRNGDIAGIIVTSQSLEELYHYLNIQLAISLMLLMLGTLAYVGWSNKKHNKKDASFTNLTIQFDAKKSSLSVGDKQLEIPYASNQYYVLDAVCKYPMKRWEQDQLLEKMGNSQLGATRAVYDAMLAINRKCGLKLISYQDKTYFCNPLLSGAVTYSK